MFPFLRDGDKIWNQRYVRFVKTILRKIHRFKKSLILETLQNNPEEHTYVY